MRKLYFGALAYMILGLASGLFYREFTKDHDFTGSSQLSVMHTHLLALGMLFFLLMMALESQLGFMRFPQAIGFYWTYHAGLLLTVMMMAVHGVRTVLDKPESVALDGISGLGHVLLTVALALLFIALFKALPNRKAEPEKQADV